LRRLLTAFNNSCSIVEAIYFIISIYNKKLKNPIFLPSIYRVRKQGKAYFLINPKKQSFIPPY